MAAFGLATSSVVHMVAVSVHENTAENSGGGLVLVSSKLFIDDPQSRTSVVHFHHNRAPMGGNIYAESSTVNASRSGDGWTNALPPGTTVTDLAVPDEDEDEEGTDTDDDVSRRDRRRRRRLDDTTKGDPPGDADMSGTASAISGDSRGAGAAPADGDAWHFRVGFGIADNFGGGLVCVGSTFDLELTLLEGYWRVGSNSSDVRRCPGALSSPPCVGGINDGRRAAVVCRQLNQLRREIRPESLNLPEARAVPLVDDLVVVGHGKDIFERAA